MQVLHVLVLYTMKDYQKKTSIAIQLNIVKVYIMM
jgi:hypothetical protein